MLFSKDTMKCCLIILSMLNFVKKICRVGQGKIGSVREEKTKFFGPYKHYLTNNSFWEFTEINLIRDISKDN